MLSLLRISCLVDVLKTEDIRSLSIMRPVICPVNKLTFGGALCHAVLDHFVAVIIAVFGPSHSLSLRPCPLRLSLRYPSIVPPTDACFGFEVLTYPSTVGPFQNCFFLSLDLGVRPWKLSSSVGCEPDIILEPRAVGTNRSVRMATPGGH